MELRFSAKDIKALKVAAQKVSEFFKVKHQPTHRWGYTPTVTIMITRTGKFKLNYRGRNGVGSLPLVRIVRNATTYEYEFVDICKAFPMQEFQDMLLEMLMENG
jgi:hypothetical protein